ncbi:MAG: double-strand break repair helicase AddA [Pseudomonadota bacterium]
MIRDDATQRQVDAAAPGRSTWVAANAGSGKTRVLTDRVARLLFSGVRPERILCLTYTRAAASEMQNRLFSRLGGWAMKADAALRDELAAMGEETALDATDLGRARQMFATAIETPGGLKIQTIHSFCASLLRRFPLEAGVSPQFSEMDDRAARRLQLDIIEAMAAGDAPEAVEAIARVHGGHRLEALAGSIIQHADRFSGEVSRDDILARFGLPVGASEALVVGAAALSKGDAALLGALVPVLRTGKSSDEKAAEKLLPLLGRPLVVADLPVLETVFLRGEGATMPFSAKIDGPGAFITKDLRNGAAATLLPDLFDLMQRVDDARHMRIALEAAEKTWALHGFAGPFLGRYEARKADLGWLDFNDLIRKTRDLLSDSRVADWVLFRLDGGIDHILVDEAQDTSPEQWQVIDLLAREFTSGQGAREDTERTIFVVGDQKQSIYSFQGADPEGFIRMKDAFGTRLSAVGRPLQDVGLLHSFRSSPAILGYADATLAAHADAGLGGAVSHKAFHEMMPGRVDIWPLLPKSDAPEDPPFDAPVDQRPADHEAVLLAAELARHIKDLVECQRETIPVSATQRRPLRYGDFLVLVQRRSGVLFRELIRAFKAADLPIAGADKMEVGEELAVRDLVALLSFLATPEDDLSLATALRSPLFCWSEDDLFRRAHPRGDREYLWAALRRMEDPASPTMRVLHDLRDKADFLRPYDLLERILTHHGGRNLLLGRLGAEAEEGIDAALSLALDYEAQEVPSLTGFLTWLAADEVRISRTIDEQSNEIRVMTVHGAKGREAPVVILPDTHYRRPPNEGGLLTDETGVYWAVPKPEAPPVIARARERLLARREEERKRLIYVAVTRAEKWLIVCGAGRSAEGTWHDILSTEVEALGAAPLETPAGTGWRLVSGDWGAGALSPAVSAPVAGAALPDWVDRRAPEPAAYQKPLNPSDLGGAKALPGDDGLASAVAMERGTRLHQLLEVLPQVPAERRADTGRELLKGVDSAELETLLAEAGAILADPAFNHIFAQGALAEVPVTGRISEVGGAKAYGVIDRLIVEPTRILAVDFKSNATVPATPGEVPDGILRQMGAYSVLLADIWPDRQIDTAILWTRKPRLMALPHDIVRASLHAAAAS